MSDKSGSGSLGELESLVLLAVLRCGAEAYGVPVREELRRQAGRSLTLGTVYQTLGRLETKGLLRAEVGEPLAVRGGRRRRLYRVTAQGKKALSSTLATLGRMSHGLDVAWGGRGAR